MAVLDRLFATTTKNFLAKHKRTVDKINSFEEELQKLSDAELRAKTEEFKKRISERAGDKKHDPLAMLEAKNRIQERKELNAILDPILPEAFAVVREAARRTVGQRPFDVQLLGGIALHEGRIAEMRTGEGKTLVATMPLYLNALLGHGAHLVTVNDYLARQGVNMYGPVYEFLGISVGIINHDSSFQYRKGELVPITRAEAYASDITYGTNNEFGFDYLRDNMVQQKEQMSQRELFFAIVDEVDSILIDEARTPLIISGPAEESGDMYMQFARLVPRLQEEHDYVVDEKDRVVSLTHAGIGKMEQLLGVANIYGGDELQLAYHLEEALKANILFKKDKDYVVREGEVIIVDEFTGRLMPGRRYSEGLHQAIEAKEGVRVQRESTTLATITFQNFFRMFTKLSGMTGTAATEEEEFIKIYNLEVVVIPTNQPMIRDDLADQIYRTQPGKYKAVVKQIRERHDKGQPILIGTISIERNELMTELLKQAHIPHEILNAKNNDREAQIIAQAGRKGAVTLATNIAGRGTDIMLGGVQPRPDAYENKAEYETALKSWQVEHDEVVALGGLHVIGTERHEARRIDNQLRGRSGRQGDPGSSQFYVSMEDDLLRIFGGDRMKGILGMLGAPEDEAVEHKMLTKAIESAQKRVEGHNFDIRKRVLQFDDVLNRHREVIYGRRKKVVFNPDDTKEVEAAVHESLLAEARHLTGLHAAGYHTEWQLEKLIRDLAAITGLNESDQKHLLEELKAFQNDAAVEQRVTEIFLNAYTHKQQQFGKELFPTIIRAVYLQTIDMLWVEHLSTMNELRTGVGLHGYAQTDPLVVYKAEGYRLFQQLLAAITTMTARNILRIERVETAQA